MSNSATVDLVNESGISIPVTESSLLSCIEKVSNGEKKAFSLVEVVFVDEDKIVEINTQHLSRTYITDIITFDYTDEDSEAIEGTLYCCAQQIVEQAEEFGESLLREFHRIIIHGLLHLCGYDDSNDTAKAQMTKLEDLYLDQISL